jgi:hypothetical protein
MIAALVDDDDHAQVLIQEFGDIPRHQVAMAAMVSHAPVHLLASHGAFPGS